MTDAPERIYIDRGPRGGWMHRHERMPDTRHEYARADLTPAMLAEAEQRWRMAERERGAIVDIAQIESGGKRWHGEHHRVVQVRWEPYKPDGQRQMKAKGRWQEQVGCEDYWSWQNCDRPATLRTRADEEGGE